MLSHRTFIVLLSICLSIQGSVVNAFVMEWVEVGDPGNQEHLKWHKDTTRGYGGVDYAFNIGKYEVTNDQYAEFLNAVAATDPNFLYHPTMPNWVEAGIFRTGVSGSYAYSLEPNMGNKPVNFVSWYDVARFANWMHNGQPVGPQNASTTEDGTYTFTAFETVGPRNPGAQVFIPDEHEWQKAGFYAPGAVTADGDEWWAYATQSDTVPTDALADAFGNISNPGPNMINHGKTANWNGTTVGNVTTVGSAGNSTYYGAYDMTGNLFEWVEADPNKLDPFEAGPYIVRGGGYLNNGHVHSWERNDGHIWGDGDSDGHDFLIWQRHFGGTPMKETGDFDKDLDVDSADLARWESAFGVNTQADGDDNHGGHTHNKIHISVGFRLAAAFEGPASAEFNGNTFVDGADLAMWELAYGNSVAGDANNDGVSDGKYFLIWQQQSSGAATLAAVTQVPEPTALVMALLAAFLWSSTRRLA
jgi:formylglycine-generating enzyme required for sulfatase activity